MAEDSTTIHLHESTKERLKELKPYQSVSFNDLVIEMADTYEEARGGQRVVNDSMQGNTAEEANESR